MTSAAETECPVCKEPYPTPPKFLPCAHIICRACVLSWLRQGHRVSCPLCRVPILTSNDPDVDLDLAVDALPTDHATAAQVTWSQLLLGRQVCDVCDDGNQATSFCFNCDMKLCQACTLAHSRFPSSRNHCTEKLNTAMLTAQLLAESASQVPCPSHADKWAELYCPVHGAALCAACVGDHIGCGQPTLLADVVAQQRALLRDKAAALISLASVTADKVTQLEQSVEQGRQDFTASREHVTQHFNRILLVLHTRRHHILQDIEARETSFLRANASQLSPLKELSPLLRGHGREVSRMAAFTPGEHVLDTVQRLLPRLDDLENRTRLAEQAAGELEAGEGGGAVGGEGAEREGDCGRDGNVKKEEEIEEEQSQEDTGRGKKREEKESIEGPEEDTRDARCQEEGGTEKKREEKDEETERKRRGPAPVHDSCIEPSSQRLQLDVAMLNRLEQHIESIVLLSTSGSGVHHQTSLHASASGSRPSQLSADDEVEGTRRATSDDRTTTDETTSGLSSQDPGADPDTRAESKLALILGTSQVTDSAPHLGLSSAAVADLVATQDSFTETAQPPPPYSSLFPQQALSDLPSADAAVTSNQSHLEAVSRHLASLVMQQFERREKGESSAPSENKSRSVSAPPEPGNHTPCLDEGSRGTDSPPTRTGADTSAIVAAGDDVDDHQACATPRQDDGSTKACDDDDVHKSCATTRQDDVDTRACDDDETTRPARCSDTNDAEVTSERPLPTQASRLPGATQHGCQDDDDGPRRRRFRANLTASYEAAAYDNQLNESLESRVGQLRRTKSVTDVSPSNSMEATEILRKQNMENTRPMTTSREAKLLVGTGARVVRGRDWSFFYADVDGGKGGRGTVLRKGEGNHAFGNGWVLVRWHTSGRSKWHRMGAEGCYDLDLVVN